MFSIFEYLYNIFDKKNKIKQDVQITQQSSIIPFNIPNKTEKIQLLLEVRHIKNIYYKYSGNILFRQELYDTFLVDNDFDSGISAFDDDTDIRIFDKYILNYIATRKKFLQNILDEGNSYQLYISSSDLEEHPLDAKYHILFIMDMTDKKIFEYCYNIYTINTSQYFNLHDILFSAIVYKDMNKYTKILK